MVRLVILLTFACQVVVAQDQPAAAVPSSSNDLFAEPDSKVTMREESPEDSARKADWKPKLGITLMTSPGGQSVVQTIVRTVPIYSTAYKEIKTKQGDETLTVRIPVQKLESREISEQVTVPGTAVVQCDGLDMAVDVAESGPRYSFSSNGPMILQYRSSVIRAESGTYSNGELKLTKASLAQAGLTMESETLVVKMTVYGITTSPQLPPSLDRGLYEPGEPYDPGALGRDTDTTDWSPQLDGPRRPVPDRGFERQDQRLYERSAEPLNSDSVDSVPQTRLRDSKAPRAQPETFDDFVPQEPSGREDSPQSTR